MYEIDVSKCGRPLVIAMRLMGISLAESAATQYALKNSGDTIHSYEIHSNAGPKLLAYRTRR